MNTDPVVGAPRADAEAERDLRADLTDLVESHGQVTLVVKHDTAPDGRDGGRSTAARQFQDVDAACAWAGGSRCCLLIPSRPPCN